MTPRNQPAPEQGVDSRWNWLFKLGGVAALLILVLFLIGVTGVIALDSRSKATSGWPASIQNNWLIVLFKLNTGYFDTQANLLSQLNLLDILIMTLFGVMFLALCVALFHTSRIWSVIAVSLPFLGIAIFLVTATAGRSGLLIGGLIFSAIMLKSNVFSKECAYVGIIASVLLFFGGDLGTAIFSNSIIIAIMIGIGYVLWMIWFFMIGRRLFQLGGSK